MADRRPISDDVTSLLDNLKRKEAELTYSIRQSQRELGKVRATLANLRALRNGAYLEDARSRTTDAVLAYMDTLAPGARLLPQEILKFADANGWASDALDARGAFASVLVRMHAAGHIDRTGHGQYYKPEINSQNKGEMQ